MSRSHVWIAIGVIIIGVASRTASAQTKSTSSSTQQLNEAKKAREILQDDMKNLSQAEHRMAEASKRVKKAVQGVETAEKDARTRLERTLGIDKVSSELDEVHRTIKESSPSIIEKLHLSDGYKNARTRLDAAKQQLAQLKSAGADHEKTKPLEKEIAENGMALTQLEREAVNSDPSLKDVNARHIKLEAELTALRRKLHDVIDDEQDVKAAHSELDNARDEFRDAKK